MIPAFLAEARDEIAALLRRRAGKQPSSRAWKALNCRVATAYRRSDNWARSTARALVARYGVIVLEDLNLKNMIRSARGTKENPAPTWPPNRP